MKTGDYVLKQTMNESGLWKDNHPLLGMLDIELTERCNNNCIHCCINLPPNDLAAKEKELATGEIKNILREAVSLGCLSVRFTGGEPLLREDFEELYVFGRRSGLKILIFTNATLITPHVAELFSRVPPLQKIEVTVYGMKKSSYEAITRTPGSFDAFQRGVDLLLKKEIPFVVKGALLPANKDDIDEFETWAATIPWMDKPPSYAMFFDLRCRRDDANKNRIIRSLRLSPQEGLRLMTRNEHDYVRAMKEFCPKFMRPSGDILFSCGAGCGNGCADAYGNFQPCMMARHPDCIYDVRNGSLKDALMNFLPGVREMKATNPEYLVRCAKCFLKGLCEQCPAKSWMEHGTLDTPVEYLCEIAHAEARFLGLVGEYERAWEAGEWRERVRKFVERKEYW
ncbi:MAG TPA: radical SAM protein [Syntrophorhabdales bacterium]|nr:radical SAM protein [Syntrophorhabdales bacterium]